MWVDALQAAMTGVRAAVRKADVHRRPDTVRTVRTELQRVELRALHALAGNVRLGAPEAAFGEAMTLVTHAARVADASPSGPFVRDTVLPALRANTDAMPSAHAALVLRRLHRLRVPSDERAVFRALSERVGFSSAKAVNHVLSTLAETPGLQSEALEYMRRDGAVWPAATDGDGAAVDLDDTTGEAARRPESARERAANAAYDAVRVLRFVTNLHRWQLKEAAAGRPSTDVAALPFTTSLVQHIDEALLLLRGAHRAAVIRACVQLLGDEGVVGDVATSCLVVPPPAAGAAPRRALEPFVVLLRAAADVMFRTQAAVPIDTVDALDATAAHLCRLLPALRVARPLLPDWDSRAGTVARAVAAALERASREPLSKTTANAGRGQHDGLVVAGLTVAAAADLLRAMRAEPAVVALPQLRAAVQRLLPDLVRQPSRTDFFNIRVVCSAAADLGLVNADNSERVLEALTAQGLAAAPTAANTVDDRSHVGPAFGPSYCHVAALKLLGAAATGGACTVQACEELGRSLVRKIDVAAATGRLTLTPAGGCDVLRAALALQLQVPAAVGALVVPTRLAATDAAAIGQLTSLLRAVADAALSSADQRQLPGFAARAIKVLAAAVPESAAVLRVCVSAVLAHPSICRDSDVSVAVARMMAAAVRRADAALPHAAEHPGVGAAAAVDQNTAHALASLICTACLLEHAVCRALTEAATEVGTGAAAAEGHPSPSTQPSLHHAAAADVAAGSDAPRVGAVVQAVLDGRNAAAAETGLGVDEVLHRCIAAVDGALLHERVTTAVPFAMSAARGPLCAAVAEKAFRALLRRGRDQRRRRSSAATSDGAAHQQS